MTDAEVWTVASELIDIHGDRAFARVLALSEERMAAGNLHAALLWKRVLAAITALRRTEGELN